MNREKERIERKETNKDFIPIKKGVCTLPLLNQSHNTNALKATKFTNQKPEAGDNEA
jgi:hypothetical protein